MVTPDKIRLFIRDKAELNYLLNNEEQFEDEEIAAFDREVREELTLQIPSLITRKEKLPDLIVVYGIIAKLMEAAANQENRNQMTISDDNVGQIDYSNKGEKYLSVANFYNQKALELASNLAASSYYNEVWGNVEMPSADYEFYEGNFY